MNHLPQRFYSLDALRGLAALTVVMVHWENMFYYQDKTFVIAFAQFPFHFILERFFNNGWRAVDLFFCLSGFIFFWLYSGKIQSQAISAKEFVVLRFSRLYPLHLATLLLVAGGQILMCQLFGSWFVCGNNDVIHFIGQLFFTSGWWGISQVSFNGPVWSVSVEIVLYAMFFLVCRIDCIRWWHLVAYTLIGEFWFIHHGHCLLIARGVLSFFIGGLSFRVFLFLYRKKVSASDCKILGAATLVLWLLIPLEAENNYLYSVYQTFFGHDQMKFADFIGRVILRFSKGSYELVLFPLTLITLASWETWRGTLGRRVAMLGDLSYSTYLLHFPLQILFMIVIYSLGISASFFSSPWALPLFFAVLLPISFCSYHFLERPAQSFLRSQLLRSDKE